MCVCSYADISRLCSCDLDLEWMTLTYELDLDILKTDIHTDQCDQMLYHSCICAS